MILLLSTIFDVKLQVKMTSAREIQKLKYQQRQFFVFHSFEKQNILYLSQQISKQKQKRRF